MRGLFCSKCGAENPEGKKYCSDCAAELGATRPDVHTPPPMAASPAKPQGEQKKAGGFWKTGAGIALIVIIGVAVLGGITAGIILAVKGGSESPKKAAVTDDTQGKLSKEMPTEEQIGLPIYPNAKIGSGWGYEADGSVIALLRTNDDFDKVVAWYREKLSGMKGFVDEPDDPKDGSVVLHVEDSEEKSRWVSIENEGGITVIALHNRK